MTWGEVLLVFAGIPAVMFMVITVFVLTLTKPTTPDGIAALQRRKQTEEAQAEQVQAEEAQDAWPQDRPDDTGMDTR